MKYRMKSLAGPFMPGQIVSEEEVKAAGGDLAFWKSHNAVEEVSDKEAAEELDMSDGAVKARIEKNIRDETVSKGRPLTKEEQDAVVANVKAGKKPPVKGPTLTPAPPPAKNPTPPVAK